MLYAYTILSGLLAEESLLVGEESDERFVPLLFVTELVVDAIRYLAIVNILLEGGDRLPHFVGAPALVGLRIIHHGGKEYHQFHIIL